MLKKNIKITVSEIRFFCLNCRKMHFIKQRIPFEVKESDHIDYVDFLGNGSYEPVGIRSIKNCFNCKRQEAK